MGKRGRQKRVKPKAGYLDPIRGVNVRKQKVEIITRKVDPSELTPPKQHIHSPFRMNGELIPLSHVSDMFAAHVDVLMGMLDDRISLDAFHRFQDEGGSSTFVQWLEEQYEKYGT